MSENNQQSSTVLYAFQYNSLTLFIRAYDEMLARYWILELAPTVLPTYAMRRFAVTFENLRRTAHICV